MASFYFETQAKLLQIAINILEDYDVKDWSFGGGTALSAVYYQHRMSYDIDIFSEDYSAINNLIINKKEIATNLGISISQVKASPGAVTFILSDEQHQLKLDFLYSEQLTKTPYQTLSILDQNNIIVQTPLEIIAKKMKYREILTIRDFVDFAFAEQTEQIVSKIKNAGIIGFDRFSDIWEQFESISDFDFNQELEYLNPIFMKTKLCIRDVIYNAFNPREDVLFAVNENDELLALDIWVEEYREDYQLIGEYHIHTTKKEYLSTVLNKATCSITYNDIYSLTSEEIKSVLFSSQATKEEVAILDQEVAKIAAEAEKKASQSTRPKLG